MRKCEGLAAVLVLGVLLCTGCGAAKVPDEITASSLVVGKEGTVTAYLVDTFDQTYYSVEELRQMAAEEVDAYNAGKGGTAVTLTDVSLTSDGGSVVVSYDFEDTSDYAEFLNTQLYYLTPEHSGSVIAELNQVLYDADGEKSITTADLMGDKLKKRHVIVVQEPTVVYAPYQVTYVSESASVSEDGSVDLTGLTEDQFPVVIALKK